MRTSLDKRSTADRPRWLVRELKPSGSLAPETGISAHSPRVSTPRDHEDSRWSSPRSRGVKPLPRPGSATDGSTDDEDDTTYFSNGQRVRTAPEVTFSRRDDTDGMCRDVGPLLLNAYKQSPRRQAPETSGEDWKNLPLSKLLQRPEDDNRPISARSDGCPLSGRSGGQGSMPFKTSPRPNGAEALGTQDWKKLNLSKLASRSEQDGEMPRSGRSARGPSSARSSGTFGWNPGGYTPRSHCDVRESTATPPYTPPLSSLVDRPSTSPRQTHASIQRMYKTLMSENERMHAELGSAVKQNDALKKSLGALEQEIAVLRNPRPAEDTSARTSRASAVPRWSQSQSRTGREEDRDSPTSQNLLRVTREKNELQAELEAVRLDLARERMRRRKLEEDLQGSAEVKEKYSLLHLRHYGHRPIHTPRFGTADASDSSMASWARASPQQSSRLSSSPSPMKRAEEEERTAPRQPRAQQGFMAWSGLVSSLGF